MAAASKAPALNLAVAVGDSLLAHIVKKFSKSSWIGAEVLRAADCGRSLTNGYGFNLRAGLFFPLLPYLPYGNILLCIKHRSF